MKGFQSLVYSKNYIQTLASSFSIYPPLHCPAWHIFLLYNIIMFTLGFLICREEPLTKSQAPVLNQLDAHLEDVWLLLWPSPYCQAAWKISSAFVSFHSAILP